MKRTSLILYLFLVFGWIGCVQRSERSVPESRTEPLVEEVETTTESATTPTPVPQPASRVVSAEGQLVAVQPALTLSFETNGRLLTVDVSAGDVVQPGDVIATLDDAELQEAVTNAELQVAQAENSLAQAQLSLDNLRNFEPDDTAVALAEANLAAAENALAQAQEQAAVSGANLTSANVQILQAQRRVEDAQEAYDTAHDPGRDWELNDPFRADALKAERESTTRFLTEAQEALSVAYAQYNISAAGLDPETAVANAKAALISAQQALEQALNGPKESEIAAAELQVEQAALGLEQSQFTLQQAKDALERATLLAPSGGTVLSVDVVVGTAVGPSTPITQIQNVEQLEFHTNNLSERDLGQIKVGQPAEVTLKAYGLETFSGRVSRIAAVSSGTVGDSATFTVVIELDETGVDLRPGMTGRVEILN